MRCISLALCYLLVPAAAHASALRVCADPSNLPFSNRAGQGFEDKIANLMARDLHQRKVVHVYAPHNEKLPEHTLNAHKCDLVMGVPAGADELETTQPYYTSTYVFVSRSSDRLKLSSLADPRLRKLKIGVHLIGDKSPPPMLALAEEGIVDNIRGYPIRANSPARPIEAVEKKEIDVAAVWGPLGGYFAKNAPFALNVTPMTDTQRFAPLRLRFPIAMGVRKGDHALRDALDAAIARDAAVIRDILTAYGVPLVTLKEAEIDKFRRSPRTSAR
jgi:mxaJ protein